MNDQARARLFEVHVTEVLKQRGGLAQEAKS